MKFGKEFKTHLEETLPEWRDKFLCYKPLKKLLKNSPLSPSDSLNLDQPINLFQLNQRPPAAASTNHHHEPHNNDHHHHPHPLVVLQEWFVRILNEELDKFNDFYVHKEEDFVIRLQELKERIERLREKSSNGAVFTSESEFSDEMMEIRKDLVTIHGKMVLLKNYSSLNFAGLVKILKKYDKRTGGLLRLPFTQLVLGQPFFTTEPLTRLVRECEANLELLFPLEEEVIESTNTTQDTQDHSNPPLNSRENISAETSFSLGEETVDIYRSTLAAMKAIRGLQKPSSTYNPLSFSPHFMNQDDEDTGAVTAENSSTKSQNGDDADQDDVYSV